METFIAVHIGAGSHSVKLEKEYRKLCRAACRKGVEVMANSGGAAFGAASAVAVLENSPLTNAGLGSNLTWDGTVECDAGVMDGATLTSATVGAVSSIRNPVLLASALLSAQRKPLSLGRVPPCILVGSGAEQWARKNGIVSVEPSALITPEAQRYFHRCKRKAEKGEAYSIQSPLDTVGAVAVDSKGSVAAACSSGGIVLKHPGRVGQAGIYGCGSWAEESVAVSVSGCGEDLIKTDLARHCGRALRVTHQLPPNAIGDTVEKLFLESPYLGRNSQRLCGVLSVKAEEGGGGEMVFAHTTESMGVGYATSSYEKPKTRISRLPDGITPGTKVIIEGVCW